MMMLEEAPKLVVTPLVAPEQEEVAEWEEEQGEEPEPRTLQEMAWLVLSRWHLEAYTTTFLGDGDGLAVIANLCNMTAKHIEHEHYWRTLYNYKPALIEAAIAAYKEEEDTDAYWATEEGIIFLETREYDQLSFHDFSDLWTTLPTPEGRSWTGKHMQTIGLELAIAYIMEWDYNAHKHVLALLAAKVREAQTPVTWLIPGKSFTISVNVETDAISLSWRF